MLKLRKWRVLPLMVVVAMLTVACGADDDDDDQGTSTETEDGAEADGEGAETAGGDPYFEGRTIELIVPYGTGGGTDTLARLMAANVGQHIPGNPNIQVINVEGGGGIIGANQFDASDPDGETLIFTSSPVVFNALIGNDLVEYEFREWEVLAALQTAGMFVSAPGTGWDPGDLTSVEDATWQGGTTDYVSAPTAVYYLLDKMGADISFLSGFDGTGAMATAFEQGELDIFNPPTSQFLEEQMQGQIEAGEVLPVLNPGRVEGGNLVRSERIPDVASAQEVWEAVHGEGALEMFEWEVFRGLHAVAYGLQKGLFAPPGTPPEALEALREGFIALEQDQEFADELYEATGDDVPTAGEPAQELFDTLDLSDEAIEEWVSWLESYGYERS